MSQVVLLRIATPFGLASSAGLNTTLPLFLTGLLNHWGVVPLSRPYSILGATPALFVLFLLVVVEFLADKLPAVSTVVHLLQWPAALVAGAFLAASQLASLAAPQQALAPLGLVLLLTWLSAGLALPLVGGLVAALVHGMRLGVRPLVTASTLGVGHVLLSLAEDGYALLLTLTALLLPVVGAVLLLALLGSLLLILGWLLRLRAGLRRLAPW